MFPRGKKYPIIYADPAWSYYNYKDNTASRWVGKEYPLMTTEDIAALPVSDIAADDCALFMWATMPTLEDAFKVIKGWGFKYKTCAFVWIKQNKVATDTLFWGMGYWTRSNAELCLLAVKGRPKRVARNIHQVIMSPLEKHSKKPDIVRDKIVQLCGDLPRIELFAREKKEKWDCWGNEVMTVLDSLSPPQPILQQQSQDLFLQEKDLQVFLERNS